MVNKPEFLSASEPFGKRFDALKALIDKSSNIVFFGGAGVSTGSGISDFRSPNGLYNNMPEKYRDVQPEYMLSNRCLYNDPELFFTFFRTVMDVRKYKPNTVHKYLAWLESQNKIRAVVTQNVDTLHETAGTKKLFKIHGTGASSTCCMCRKKFDENFIFENTDPIPRCTCGGLVRPDVVLYGESLPDDQVIGAIEAIKEADLLIACGTSLTVQPAASFVSYMPGNASLVIINRDSTQYDSWADISFREDMNDIFEKLMPKTE